MTKPQTIYVVTEGEYSDYHIEGIFATREVAEAFLGAEKSQAGRYFDGQIEEWQVYDYLPERRVIYVIQRLQRDGKVTRHQSVQWPWESPMFEGHKRESWNYYHWGGSERAWGTDEAAVEKIWKERHAAEEAGEAGL